ncbi:lipopolysaccharide assembly protein LapB [Deinococcus sp. AJ005]|uniref:tetratricopeptide repeat protein n=1 Tax=Deinococcus sp. AJ005 TaxID=2652443 RepID=UPI00125CAA8C|nr:hypothetical protein [Deinococcus sp. AJ005]QFP78531.1 hypothetical protein DAAJ005_18330 [Deinococcus sp. AJ005]
MSSLPVRRRSQVRFSVPEPMPQGLARPRLQEQLTDLTIKVAALLAPSGYGKTVLLAQWARQQNGNVIWLKLHQEDRDAHFFLQSLVDAFQYFGLNLSYWKSGAILETSPSRALLALLNDVNNHPSDLTLIVDGGEHLSDDSANLLNAFVDGLGEGHRIFVAQHEASSFQIAPFLASGIGTEINAGQLRFTEHEVDVLARTFEAGQLPPSDLHGWPAGVMLEFHAQNNQLQAGTEHLLLTLVRRLPEDIQHALPALSVMEIWTPTTPSVLHLNLPGDWLDQVRRVGLPVLQQGKAFIPHDALREYLQDTLQRDQAQFKTVQGYAAQQADREGRPYAATLHFLAAGQIESALSMIQNLVPGWYRTANWKIAIDLLSKVPDGFLTSELRSLLALSLGETGEGERAETLARRQIDLFPTATAYYALALRNYRTNNFDEMQKSIDGGLETIRVTPSPTNQRDTIQLLRSQAVLFISSGKPEAALEVAEDAVSRAMIYGDNSLRIATQSVKAHIMRGMKYDSEILLEQYFNLYKSSINENPHRMMPVVQTYARQLNRVRRPRESLEILKEYTKNYGEIYPLADFMLIGDISLAYLSLGDYENSLETALKGYKFSLEHDHKGYLSSNLFTALWIYFGTDRLQEAEALLRSSLHQIDQTPPRAGDDASERAFFKFILGVPVEALELADQAFTFDQVPETAAVLLSMLILHQKGEVSKDLGHKLREALSLYSEDHALYQVAFSKFEPIFQAYKTAGIEKNFFDDLLANAYLIGQIEKKKLRLTVIGHFRIDINGMSSRLGYSTALETLIYRVLHPGASQDEITVAIWPLSDLARGRGSVQQARRTVNRTFQTAFKQPGMELLQTAGSGRRNPGWMIDTEVHVSCDALDILSSTDAQTIQNLYKGSFLPSSNHEWVIDFRVLIARHVARVYQAHANALGETSDALQWLMRAAMADQEPDTFERVMALSRVLGRQEIERSAQQALEALREGHAPYLTHWTN